MLQKGKQVSVYKIKEIISEESTHICCLTEDPFFHSSVLLKVYPVDFLQDKQQEKRLGEQLENIFLLEHPSIAPVLDSGFDRRQFYYTTKYDHLAPLRKRIDEGLSTEAILKIGWELCCALEYARDRGIAYGGLSIDNIYSGDDDQAVIADFGVEHCFRQFKAEQDEGWSEELALQNLGRLQLQLLRPSGTDNRGRELELIAGIDNQSLQKLLERFFVDDEDRYGSFSELKVALAALLEQPPQETRPVVQQKSLQVCNDTGISLQQREQVLPHVRQLITEKNHYKNLLDKALLGQSQTESELKQAREELDQLTRLQLEAPVAPVAENRKRIAVWALGGFCLGMILSGSYGYTLQQKNSREIAAPQIAVVKQSRVVEDQVIATVKSAEPPQVAVSGKNDAQKTTVDVDKPRVGIAAAVTEEKEPLAQSTGELDPPLPLLVEKTQQWLPAGQEFSAAAAALPRQLSPEPSVPGQNISTVLSPEERDIIFQNLLHWADSWSEQNPETYFAHYSENYRPAHGSSREKWLQTRKARLLRPDWIKVEIQDISIRPLGDNRVQVKFQQSYRSNYYQDQIMKSLNLVYEEDSWQILTERSLGKIGLVASR